MDKIIDIECRACKDIIKISVPEEPYNRYMNNRGNLHIQDILPMLTAGERELMISGFCDTCFDRMFSEE